MAGVEPFEIRHYTESQLVIDGWAFSRYKEVPLANVKVGISFVDIMLDVKNASNAVNDQELMYCVLSSLQCSTAQMAELLNNADGTLRSRKARLKEKMPENLCLLFFS